ncbi:hypothetical protein CCS01_16095 [Rhodopila globiformis]|uniref:Uncharacterized protein n=1 Tax=Rhodopila globiformis TaxID=1071 RepID=A0A2S6NBR7_RHOGL|nr:hypothetical protein CCS01_16095 [Rhodopila globiformis]
MSEAVSSAIRDAWPNKTTAEQSLMGALQDRLSVGLIATPRHLLRTCRTTEPLAEVVARNDEGFDYFPVTDSAH